MKESYEEDLAHHFGLQRRGDCGNKVVLSVRAEGPAGQLLSSEITTFACRSCSDKGEGYTVGVANGEMPTDAAESEN